MLERERFDSGNLAAVAARGDPDDWRTCAARALLGVAPDACAALAECPEPGARFCLGAALWVDGREVEALRVLASVESEHSRNLQRLIRKPVIDVLAQISWVRRGPWDLLGGAADDPHFRVRNASYHPDDAAVRPYADVHALYPRDTPPDLYLCQNIEWHLVPPNLHELACPTFGQTGDYDLHIQALYPWLDLFDELVVADPTEWADVSRLVERPVWTFPKTYGLARGLPAIPAGPRPFDVFQSGTLTHLYHPDKAERLHEVLSLENVRMSLVDGFVPEAEYARMLGECKLSYTHVRHPGAVPTRGLDALAMGCAVAVQQGSALSLFTGPEFGVVEYGAAPGDLGRTLVRALADWPGLEAAAQRGASRVREEFAMPRVTSQFLRFLCVLAARPRSPRAPRPVAARSQKRSILCTGWSPSGSGPRELEALRRANLERWDAEPAGRGSLSAALDATRELALAHASRLRDPDAYPEPEDLIGELERRFGAALRDHPNSLALRFNAARVAFHWGTPKGLSFGLRLAGETLERPEDDWQLEPLDDVFPWDLFGSCFHYRAYFDAVTETLLGDGDRRATLVRLIRASLSHYLGLWRGDVGQLERAVELDPAFPVYRWSLARAWLERDAEGDRERALALLAELGQKSALLWDVHAMLRHRHAEAEDPGPGLAALEARLGRSGVRRAGEGVLGFDLAPERGASSDPLLRVRRAGPACPRSAPPLSLRPPSGSKPPRLSVLLRVLPGQETLLEGALDDLARQSLAPQLELALLLPHGTAALERYGDAYRARFAHLFSLHDSAPNRPWVAVNRALERAQAELVTLLNPADRLRPDALERLYTELAARPEFAGIYADSLATREVGGSYEAHEPMGFIERRPFALHHLLVCPVPGPQAVWRRELHARWGGFDESLEWHADWDFWLRIAESERMLHCPERLGLNCLSLARGGTLDWDRERASGEELRARWLPRFEWLQAAWRQPLLPRPAERPGLLVLLQSNGNDLRAVQRSLDELRALHAPGELAVRVVLADGATARAGSTQPPLETLSEALARRATWRYPHLLVLRGSAPLAAARIAELVARAAADPALSALVPPGSRAEPARARYVLLRSQSVFDVGGADPASPDLLGDLLTRLEAGGACVAEGPSLAPPPGSEPGGGVQQWALALLCDSAPSEPRRYAGTPAEGPT